MRPEIASPPSKTDLAAFDKKAMYVGPDTQSLGDYIDFADQEAAWHKNQERNLRIGAAAFDELQFYGGLTGAVAGALQHLQAARNALGTAAGAGILNSRYQLTVQATIYKGANEAFICIRDALAEAKMIEDRVPGLNVVTDYPESAKQVRSSSKALLQKVEAKMLAIQLPTPDFKGLKDALGAPKETPAIRPGKNAFAAAAITSGALTGQDAEQLGRLKNDIKACEVAFN